MATVRDAQRFRALGVANSVRSRRAEFKRGVRDGVVSVEDALREPEWFLSSMPVHQLVGLKPGLRGSAQARARRVSRLLRKADVWPLREVGLLTVRQRERLLFELGVWR